MGFKTDGSVHHGGVKNEDLTVRILNEHKIYPATVEKRGGTKCKEDAVAADKKISIKRKEGIKNGSFDWFNTSAYNDVLGDTFTKFIASVKEARNLPKSIRFDDEFITHVRDNFNELCEQALDTLSAEQIVNVLQRGLIDNNSGFDVVVNDTKSQEIYIFSADDHPAVSYIERGFIPVLKGNGKSSRKVIFTDGATEYDCGLRIRVTSNNGINAFLGNSKANSNSQVVMKLQQDKVANLLEQVAATVTVY
jgi:hypothetical protein